MNLIYSHITYWWLSTIRALLCIVAYVGVIKKNPNFTMRLQRSSVITAVILFILDGVKSRKEGPLVDPSCECGWSGEGVSTRIIGGIVTIPNVYPWVAGIFMKQSLHCGGALINDRYVLTAGHCVQWAQSEDLDVGLGLHDIENLGSGYILPVEHSILHEDFESDYLHDTNDIALIKLRYPVKFTETIQPICLPMKGSDYTGHYVKVTGWGRTKTNEGSASRFLRQTTLQVLDYQSCVNTSFGDHITESMMCAYAENKDACQGDSGGSLLYKRPDGKYETIGIVSWGLGCARRGYPGVYVKLTDYLHWIRTHTKDAIYCIDR